VVKGLEATNPRTPRHSLQNEDDSVSWCKGIVVLIASDSSLDPSSLVFFDQFQATNGTTAVDQSDKKRE
jgi:hypothetical protein